MNKKANNFWIIIITLLLVVGIITGAGLCYLSWSDESFEAGNQETTEIENKENLITSEVLADAREEGRKEVLEDIQKDLDANISAEDILNRLLGIEKDDSKAEDTPETPNGETSESEPEKVVLRGNPITMEDIQISADGEYQYIQNSEVCSRKGIDVSKYQGDIDWKKVAADWVEFAYIRLGCRGYGNSGTLIMDEYFHKNMQGALSYDIQTGAYFFSQAVNVEEAIEEAKMVVKELEPYKDRIYNSSIAIDIETVDGQKARQDALTKEERTEVCIAFCEYIKEAGYTPMVYGDLETFSELFDVEQLAEYDFWLCETDGKMTFPYGFDIWQYSHKGRVSGIKGDVNLNISIPKG
jgi:GH25 family lysozyme M1 (1,4-beta-N-acetylmuramidase)